MKDSELQLITELIELAEDFVYPKREEIYERAGLLWDGLVCRSGSTAGGAA